MQPQNAIDSTGINEYPSKDVPIVQLNKAGNTFSTVHNLYLLYSALFVVIFVSLVGIIFWYSYKQEGVLSVATKATASTTKLVTNLTPMISPIPSTIPTLLVQRPDSFQSVQEQLEQMQQVMSTMSTDESNDYSSLNTDLNNSSLGISEEQKAQQL